MTIEHDSHNLPPILPYNPPLIQVVDIAAVECVHMITAHAPHKAFARFYEEILGFTKADPHLAGFAYTFGKHRVEFLHRVQASHDGVRPGHLILLIAQFDTALRVLSDEKIPYDHTAHDLGLARAVTFFDPGGNQVTMIQHRPL